MSTFPGSRRVPGRTSSRGLGKLGQSFSDPDMVATNTRQQESGSRCRAGESFELADRVSDGAAEASTSPGTMSVPGRTSSRISASSDGASAIRTWW